MDAVSNVPHESARALSLAVSRHLWEAWGTLGPFIPDPSSVCPLPPPLSCPISIRIPSPGGGRAQKASFPHNNPQPRSTCNQHVATHQADTTNGGNPGCTRPNARHRLRPTAQPSHRPVIYFNQNRPSVMKPSRLVSAQRFPPTHGIVDQKNSPVSVRRTPNQLRVQRFRDA